MFCLYHFSLKCIIKNLYLLQDEPLNSLTNINICFLSNSSITNLLDFFVKLAHLYFILYISQLYRVNSLRSEITENTFTTFLSIYSRVDRLPILVTRRSLYIQLAIAYNYFYLISIFLQCRSQILNLVRLHYCHCYSMFHMVFTSLIKINTLVQDKFWPIDAHDYRCDHHENRSS